jgi:hypothetical protein
MESNSTAFLIKIKLRHSLGRPSRSDFVQSKFVGLVNLDFGKYKNVSHYGFNAVCKEKQYDWVCYCLPLSDSP